MRTHGKRRLSRTGPTESERAAHPRSLCAPVPGPASVFVRARVVVCPFVAAARMHACIASDLNTDRMRRQPLIAELLEDADSQSDLVIPLNRRTAANI